MNKEDFVTFYFNFEFGALSAFVMKNNNKTVRIRKFRKPESQKMSNQKNRH